MTYSIDYHRNIKDKYDIARANLIASFDQSQYFQQRIQLLFITPFEIFQQKILHRVEQLQRNTNLSPPGSRRIIHYRKEKHVYLPISTLKLGNHKKYYK